MQMELVPGTWVVSPDHPEWGLGQVQSALGARITVNFEHAGKMLVVTDHVTLTVVDGPDARRQNG